MPADLSLATLIARGPVFDSHVDSLQLALDLGHDLGLDTPGHLNLVSGRRGGLGAVVFVSWVDPACMGPDGSGARARTTDLLAEFHALAERHPGQLRWAGNGELLSAAREAGCVAGIPGIEGGHSIEESLEALEWFFERGVRVMTLVWNNHLTWVRSCHDGAGPEVPEGLSDFGRDVVRRMNELGMLVDLSHASRRAFYDTLETAAVPTIASHSGCSVLNDHPRNLDDDQLRALRDSGGVVGIVFCTPFLDAEAGRAEAAVRESRGFRALEAENPTALFLAQGDYLQSHVPPLPLERVLDHVLHAVKIAGVEHVGLGSDYDGIQARPEGLEDASCYGNLAAGLMRRGLSEREVLAVLGGNMERVFRTVTGPGTRAASADLLPLGRSLG